MRQGKYKRVLTKAEARTAVELHDRGWSLARIARVYGISKQGIWRLLRRRGVDTGNAVQVRGDDGRYIGVRRRRRVSKEERDEAGVIVTLVHTETGHSMPLHVPGKRIEALRHVADMIDNAGGRWRVICYSTPETILGDLQGIREAPAEDQLGASLSPEARALGTIGRLDLLDESLRRRRN